ncbi:protein kinase domain-containing protein [Planctomycetaceae bacterium SH139]
MNFRRDQELLLILLAAQMGLIDSQQLRDVLAAWQQDATQPALKLLRQQPGLSEEQLGLISALAENHLQQHAGRLNDSLAALSLSTSVELTLEQSQVLTPELAATVCATGNSKKQFERKQGSSPPANSGSDAPQSPGRFSIVRPHAKGGLGEVYVALDHELNRQVALKEIQSDYAFRESSRNRFIAEAEITGGLEHPGIVPVYGLGTYDDGRPYYAMRLIKGQSMAEAALRFHQQHPPRSSQDYLSSTFRELLRRFIDVCNSIEYAHARGVLHRDLKPGNIMLGKYGETLVVDWGLAKTMERRSNIPAEAEASEEDTLRLSSGSDVAHTAMGQVLGTLAYISPEAASGDIESIGVASDVYCLGGTLYFLLTGSAPHKGSSTEVLEAVKSGRFCPPQQVNPHVPKALAAICLKAMHREAPQRYSGAQALSKDIEAWLADEPVSACRDPLAARFSRVVRKNRELFAASTVFALLLLVGTVVTSLLLSQKNQDLKTAYGVANDNLRYAEEQRNLAEEQAGSARKMALTITELAEKKLSESNSETTYRESLMDSAYALFKDSHDRDPKAENVSFDLANIARLTANVKGLLNKYPEALALIEESITLQTQLERDDPAADLYLAHSYRDQGSFAKASGDLTLAATAFDNALTLLRALNSEDEADAEIQLLQGTMDIERVGLAIEMLDDDQALSSAKQAEQLFLQRVAGEQPQVLDFVFANMAAYRHGQALYRLNNPAAGREIYQRAIERGEQWLERFPTINLENVQARLHLYFATDLAKLEPLADDAAKLADEAIRRYQKMLTAGGGTKHRYYVARAQQTRANIALRENDTAAAQTGWSDALANLRLVLAEKETADYFAALASLLRDQAEYHTGEGAPITARELLEQAVDAQRAALEQSPDSLLVRQTLSELEDELGKLSP